MRARWPVGPMRRAMPRQPSSTHARGSDQGDHDPAAPARRGEVVQSVFDRLGPRSRLLRFGGAKTTLSAADLELLTRVDADHHVLVALADNDPIGIARLVRNGADADVAFAVVDEWQHRGVGTILADRLAADARAAGIERLHATMHADNRSSLALMRRVTERPDDAHRRRASSRSAAAPASEDDALPRLEYPSFVRDDVFGQVDDARRVAARVRPDAVGARQRAVLRIGEPPALLDQLANVVERAGRIGALLLDIPRRVRER